MSREMESLPSQISNSAEIYFQTQKKLSLMCGKHSLNNLLGKNQFTEHELNGICQQLSDSWINPHRYCCKIIGGDFDANVLMIALQNSEYETIWHDNRKNVDIQANMNTTQQNSDSKSQLYLVGYLVNFVPETSIFGKIATKLFCMSSRHWCALKLSAQSHSSNFLWLDSLDERPSKMSRSDAESFLDHKRKNQSGEIIKVYSKRQNNE